MRRSLVPQSALATAGPGAAVGICAIASYRPAWSLDNAWYQPKMPRKFAQHTGILARGIAEEDEVNLATRAIDRLCRAQGIRMTDCAGLVVVCPSLIPARVAHRYLPQAVARREQPMRVARAVAQQLRITPRRILGINSFCSGYARAMSLVLHTFHARRGLQADEFVLVVTANRISRITDFGCPQAGALFGDLATATLIARRDSGRYPVRFELIDAHYRKQPAPQAYFDFDLRRDVLIPTRSGGRTVEPERLVFRLDGMGIADTAPRAMADAAASLLAKNHVRPDQVEFVVPHQAGSGIVRFTQMKLEAAGISAEVINGLTRDTGNVSSGSVPYALERHWTQLYGTILCPVAAVGAPGVAEVSQGCILLRGPSRPQSQAA